MQHVSPLQRTGCRRALLSGGQSRGLSCRRFAPPLSASLPFRGHDLLPQNQGLSLGQSPDAQGSTSPKTELFLSPSPSLATQGLPCTSHPVRLRTRIQDVDVKLTRRQRTLQTSVRVARRRQCQQPASLQAQDLQGGRRTRSPPPPQPLSFLYCDWKPENRLPIRSPRSIPFKDKGSSVRIPSSSLNEQVTFWWLRRPPLSARLTVGRLSNTEAALFLKPDHLHPF